MSPVLRGRRNNGAKSQGGKLPAVRGDRQQNGKDRHFLLALWSVGSCHDDRDVFSKGGGRGTRLLTGSSGCGKLLGCCVPHEWLRESWCKLAGQPQIEGRVGGDWPLRGLRPTLWRRAVDPRSGGTPGTEINAASTTPVEEGAVEPMIRVRSVSVSVSPFGPTSRL